MIKFKGIIFCLLVAASFSLSCSPNEIFIEAESFTEKGGWVSDSQFMDQMGSPYLLAHGLGRPVADAGTEIDIKKDGTYHVYVRTYNWTSPWTEEDGPGKFSVKVGGYELPNVLGCKGNVWEWQYAGSLNVKKGKTSVSLHDMTGFDGRCDAILLSTAKTPSFESIRERLVPSYDIAGDGGEYDFIVVGGGIAGMSAAVAASRLGMKTALIQDRPVLGGNNSSEVRVHATGLMGVDPYPNLGLMMREYGHAQVMNGDNDGSRYNDAEKASFVSGEKNLTVFYNTRIIRAEMDGNRISAVLGRNTETGSLTRFSAPLFSDCTGDGNLGFLAGADYRVGRESKEETGERSASKVADCQVLGASVMWNTIEEQNSEFPVFEYGLQFCEESVQPLYHGEWRWETGMRRDQIGEAERIRDYGMLVVYSNWSFLKHNYSGKDSFADRKLNWVAYVLGKRESRRLLGDYILNQTDIEAGNVFEDATVTLSWPIDLHYPKPENSKYFPGEEFLSVCNQDHIPLYPLPYRCLYSRNIENMFMAGRDISVTHVALGTVRVMRTTAMMGEVVGMAASICNAHSCLPRAVYTDFLPELQDLMIKGVGNKDLPDTQNYDTGRTGCNGSFASPDVE